MPPKKFVFRLQSVLEVRIREEEEEKKKFAELVAWQRREEQLLAQLQAKERDTRGRLKAKQQTGEWLEVDELKRITYFLKKLEEDIKAKRALLLEIAQRIEEQRLALLHAATEKKKVEMLREQQELEFNNEIEAEERKLLDELATLKYAREGYGDAGGDGDRASGNDGPAREEWQ